MQSAIETRPRIGRANCVSISPETVTYLVLLGVVVVQDRVLGCLHFFLIIVIIIIIIVLLFPHFLLGADGEPHPAAPGQGCPRPAGRCLPSKAAA